MVEAHPFYQIPWRNVRDLERRVSTVESRLGSANSIYVNTAFERPILPSDLTAGVPNRSFATRGLDVPSLGGADVQCIGDLVGRNVFIAKTTSDAYSDTTGTAPLVRTGAMVLVFPKRGAYNLMGLMRYLLQLSAFDSLSCGLTAFGVPSMSLWSVGKVHYSVLPTTTEFMNCTYTPILASYNNWWSRGSSYGTFKTDIDGLSTRMCPAPVPDTLTSGWEIRCNAQEYNGEHILQVGSDSTAVAGGGFDAYALMPLFWAANTYEGENVLPRLNLLTSWWHGQLAIDLNYADYPIGVSRFDGVTLPSL